MVAAECAVSEQELQVRRSQNASVLGTLAMEGLTLDAQSAEIGRRFDAGEITLSEFSAAMQAHIARLASGLRHVEETNAA
jgi:hypothetical protein